MSREIDYRQLDPIAQAAIYSAFVGCFLQETFEEQMRAVMSLSAGMCGLELPDAGAQQVLERASGAACSILLEHGDLLDRPRWAA